MPSASYPLSKLRHEYGKTVIDKASGMEVFHAPHSRPPFKPGSALTIRLFKYRLAMPGFIELH
jgi:hypothetical protein